jgi:hypothetical protein
MVTITPEGIITNVNEATVTVLGVPRDQLIETPIHLYHVEVQDDSRLLDQPARPQVPLGRADQSTSP